MPLPEFNPSLTPHEMLQLGVFEGKYLNATLDEYPAEWRDGAKLSSVANPMLNAFKNKSRMSLGHWKSQGWINEQDPLGWFQWYCRYYMGRRSEDDQRQISRHRAFVRHSAQVLKNGRGDRNVRIIQRQALLQWAHDPFPDVTSLAGESSFKKVKRVFGSSAR